MDCNYYSVDTKARRPLSLILPHATNVRIESHHGYLLNGNTEPVGYPATRTIRADEQSWKHFYTNTENEVLNIPLRLLGQDYILM